MKVDELTAALSNCGLSCDVLANEYGGAVVCLERGARVIGLYTDARADNALWLNKSLLETFMDNAGIGQKDWNIGGDRTWISPELEYFVSDLRHFWTTYEVPASLDPGSYTKSHVDRSNDQVTSYVQQFSLHAYRHRDQPDFSITKTISLIPDPVDRTGEMEDMESYSYIGYQSDTALAIEKSNGPLPASLWQLMQVPAGGRVIIATIDQAVVHDFFEPVDLPRLVLSEKAVYYTLDARQQQKISIKASHLQGRVGYEYAAADNEAYLLVRQFQVQPDGDYRDASLSEPDDRGHCLQCYNDDGALGHFGEIEYHTPVMDSENGINRLDDVSQVWCYRGSMSTLERIRKHLLGV